MHEGLTLRELRHYQQSQHRSIAASPFAQPQRHARREWCACIIDPLHIPAGRLMHFPKYLRLTTLAAALAASLGTEAAIVKSPATIVDSGTFITDTVNQLDWYKFSNAQTTDGLSYNEVIASNFFADGGWSVASPAQVASLWSQFGYQYDTHTPEYVYGSNANSGLTLSLASLLGSTNTGCTSDYCVIFANTSASYTTDTHYAALLAHYDYWSTHPYGEGRVDDWVNLYAYVTNDAAQYSEVGTWLVRPINSANDIPEPNSFELLLVAALFALAVHSKRRAAMPADGA